MSNKPRGKVNKGKVNNQTTLLARIEDFDELIPRTREFIERYEKERGSNPKNNPKLLIEHLLSFGLYRMKLHGRSIARVLLEVGYDNKDIGRFLSTTSLPISDSLFVGEVYRKAKQAGSYVDGFQLVHDILGDMQPPLNLPFEERGIDKSSYLADYGTYLLWIIKEFDKEDRRDFCNKIAKTIIETAKKRPIEQYLWMLELLRSDAAPLIAANPHEGYDASFLDEAISQFSRIDYQYFISSRMKFDILLDLGFFSDAEQVFPRAFKSLSSRDVDWYEQVALRFGKNIQSKPSEPSIPHLFDGERIINVSITQSRGTSNYAEYELFNKGYFFGKIPRGSLKRMMRARHTGDKDALSELEKDIMQRISPEYEFVYKFYLAGKLTGYSDEHILQALDSIPLTERFLNHDEPFIGLVWSNETESSFRQKAKATLGKIIPAFRRWEYIEFVHEYVTLLENIRREQRKNSK